LASRLARFFWQANLPACRQVKLLFTPLSTFIIFFSLITPWEHCRATCQVPGKSTCLYFESCIALHSVNSQSTNPTDRAWLSSIEIFENSFSHGKSLCLKPVV
jgi:hypothetical protein